jgi:hypothetical protein
MVATSTAVLATLKILANSRYLVHRRSRNDDDDDDDDDDDGYQELSIIVGHLHLPIYEYMRMHACL